MSKAFLETTIERARVLNEIVGERKYQDEMWGTDFDDKNTLNDWISYIVRYAGQANRLDCDPQGQRTQLIKVATLAVAAIEACDRNGGFAPRHYEDMAKKD